MDFTKMTPKQAQEYLANRNILKDIQLPILDSSQLLPDQTYPHIINVIEGMLTELHKQHQLLLPMLRESETISVFSDYGGDHKEALFHTYSFLFVEWNNTAFFFDKMAELREKYKLNKPFKEIEYKQLHYGPINRSLQDYLYLANNTVNGLLFNLIVEKIIYSILGPNKKETIKEVKTIIEKENLGTYNPHTAEKVLRIIHIIGYFTRLLSKQGQKVFWMTDNDAIIPDINNSKGFRELFGNILALYAPSSNYYNLTGYAVPFKKENQGDKPMIDLLSLTDLSAGAIEHYFTRDKKMAELTVKEHANKIVMWLALQGIGLKKLNVVVRDDGKGNVKIGLIDFKLKQPLNGSHFINIRL